MLSNSKAKYIKSLSIKKFRLKHKRFLCEGDKITRELIKNSTFKIELIAALQEWIDENQLLLHNKALTPIVLNEKELKKVSNLNSPNKVLAVVEIPDSPIQVEEMAKAPVLYLDGIQDPGNLGTIIRIADWFGYPFIICSPNCVDLYNTKVIQASMGGFLSVKIMVETLSELRKLFPEKKIYGADLTGQDIFKMEFAQDEIIVIGNEGNGIHPSNKQYIDQLITIPAHPKSGAESLNAAVATGIICAFIRNS